MTQRGLTRRGRVVSVLGIVVVVLACVAALLILRPLIANANGNGDTPQLTQPTLVPTVVQQKTPTASPVVESLLQETPEPTAPPEPETANAPEEDSPYNMPAEADVNEEEFDVVVTVREALPMYQDLRYTNRQPGDISRFLIKFHELNHVVLQRLVADDELVSAVYYPGEGEDGLDLLPLLEMAAVSDVEPENPQLRAYLESRGVDIVLGEQLAQNMNMVFLGDVSQDAYIIVEFKDNPSLNVNNGGLIAFVHDTDPYTVDANGAEIENPTFILQEETP